MTPLIGITTHVQTTTWGDWTMPAASSPRSLVEGVRLAGGRPILIPPMECGNDGLVEKLDGLLMSGGPDVRPETYGQKPHHLTECGEYDRDAGEFDLLAEAMERRLPILGVCRGAQVLNVLRGGTLTQHVPDLVGHDTHAQGAGLFGLHEIRTEPGSLAAAIVGATGTVPSHHHQAVDRLGHRLRVTAWALDGVIEAIEMSGDSQVLGVQWHPEAATDHRVFEWLVERSAAVSHRV